MVQTSRRARARGLCLFDPNEAIAGDHTIEKASVAQRIRETETLSDIYIAEQFGKFEPARLETFFDPIRRQSQSGAS
jgi:hypothetical protein